MLDAVTVNCQECRVELAGDSPELRLELTCDDEPDRLLRDMLAARVRRRLRRSYG